MLEYGKEITQKSYFKGQLKSTKVEYSIPIIIQDKTQALSEIIKTLELITSKDTHKVSFTIEADPKSYHLKMITKNYTIDL